MDGHAYGRQSESGWSRPWPCQQAGRPIRPSATSDQPETDGCPEQSSELQKQNKGCCWWFNVSRHSSSSLVIPPADWSLLQFTGHSSSSLVILPAYWSLLQLSGRSSSSLVTLPAHWSLLQVNGHSSTFYFSSSLCIVLLAWQNRKHRN